MKRVWLLLFLLPLMVLPCRAIEYSAPEVPDAGSRYMPDDTQSFGEGFLYILSTALEDLHPALTESVRTCVSLVSVALLVGILNSISSEKNSIIHMTGLIISSILMLRPSNSMITLAVDTIAQISQYGKVLLPVMTGALAAQGAVTKSGALYTATIFFDNILTTWISNCLVPLVYVFMCLCAVHKLGKLPLLTQLKQSIKDLISWGLKTLLYVFTGYISITGVVSGSTDAAMLKATKLTIASTVPVVGGILSDASEAVLVSAGLVKNAAGIYGLLAMIAVGIGPFLRIGIQYLMLKLSASVCHTMEGGVIGQLVKDFSEAMGMVLGMLGTISLVQLISVICYLRGTM